MGVFSPVHRSIPVISISSLFLFSSAPHGREYKPKTFTKDIPEKQLFRTERLTFFLSPPPFFTQPLALPEQNPLQTPLEI
ncbi:MAG: hypothetical protein D3903_04700 [Candidatus Electrothrix sp. GM3_4]|nr:hypothetical protein [Candidatus Electrothrix sp. GM3_4]